MFTPLHKALGLPSGDITSQMIDAAIEQSIEESASLDYKAKAPQVKKLKESDLAKDIAAMANSGGGILIFGVTDSKGRPGERCDVGVEIDERYRQAFQQLALSKISPPVFGVELFSIPGEGNTPDALVAIIPESSNTPHLLDKGKDSFGVPVRAGADTHWLNEAEMARLYRDRFSYQERSREALHDLYKRTVEIGGESGVWIVGVAKPRRVGVRGKVSNAEAFKIGNRAGELSGVFHDVCQKGGISSLYGLGRQGRRGFRCWMFSFQLGFKDQGGLISLHDDGSVQTLLSSRPGLGNEGEDYYSLWDVGTELGSLVAAAMAQAEVTGISEYDFQFGVEWAGKEPIAMWYGSTNLAFPEYPVHISEFLPIETSLDVSFPNGDALVIVRDVVEDCVNQFGISRIDGMKIPAQ